MSPGWPGVVFPAEATWCQAVNGVPHGSCLTSRRIASQQGVPAPPWKWLGQCPCWRDRDLSLGAMARVPGWLPRDRLPAPRAEGRGCSRVGRDLQGSWLAGWLPSTVHTWELNGERELHKCWSVLGRTIKCVKCVCSITKLLSVFFGPFYSSVSPPLLPKFYSVGIPT